jgi:hypothetical protein
MDLSAPTISCLTNVTQFGRGIEVCFTHSCEGFGINLAQCQFIQLNHDVLFQKAGMECMEALS